ncbi:hypothetical protein [Streptomyces purpureus]|uniref:Uncharacterized protein n=1 Tax=Streptomyces purpureus TaxID=1951 RepID=A0A918HDL7_9ACTN|nr:hypothetical protein [Streptomyces purpureus]GGT54268.1 hypothetical protein GCM10014713_55050 [Streptomyces purpureus]
MSDGLTLDGLAVPLRVLRLLATDFGHLPAPAVHLSGIFPNRLELSLHDDLAEFETWRDALGIAPDAVKHSTQSDGRTRVLKASVEYAGAELELVAYARVPDYVRSRKWA